MPEFSLESYGAVLDRLARAGYCLRPASEIAESTNDPTVYLRHDVDLHLARVDEFAAIEADAGARASYYVPLTQQFNVVNPDNATVLARVVALGHDLGLHYDLECYPTDRGAAAARLEWEVGVLEHVSGCRVRTICMHNPHRGHADWFRTGTPWTNPHDSAYSAGLLYVSDSCRAWRDQSLLSCFGSDPPRRVLLNTHPELWFEGSIRDRKAYLEAVVIPTIVGPQERWLRTAVRDAWERHAGARAHDGREGVA